MEFRSFYLNETCTWNLFYDIIKYEKNFHQLQS